MSDHTITLSAANETQVDRARRMLNERMCISAGLPITAPKAEVTAVNPDLGAQYTNDVDAFVKQLAKNSANALCAAVGLPNGSLP